MSSPLVARRKFEPVLDTLLDSESSPSILFLVGPSGSGKSTLLREWMRGPLARRGEKVLHLSFSWERSVPALRLKGLLHKVLQDWTGAELDPQAPLGRWLDPLPPQARGLLAPHVSQIRTSVHPEKILRAFVLALEALVRSAKEEVVVILEDVDSYLGPEDGLGLHHFYQRSPHLKWILTGVREDRVEDRDRDPIETVHVGPLSRAETYRLAAELLEGSFHPIPRSILHPIYEFSRGLPGFVIAICDALLSMARHQKGTPGPEEVQAAFLQELAEPFGRIGLWLESKLKAAAAWRPQAVLAELSQVGGLGAEALAQRLGWDLASTQESLEVLRELGWVRMRGRSFLPRDPWMTLRHRVQGLGGLPASIEDFLSNRGVFEDDAWGRGIEADLKLLLEEIHGRRLPGMDFGTVEAVLVPSSPQWEAVVGMDSRGALGPGPGVVAMDLLLNGRDKRWVVEFSSAEAPLGLAELEAIHRRFRFFQASSRRSLHKLWVIAPAGFLEETRIRAQELGILSSDLKNLRSLQASFRKPQAA